VIGRSGEQSAIANLLAFHLTTASPDYQCLSDHPITRSPDHLIIGSPDHLIIGSPDHLIIGSPD